MEQTNQPQNTQNLLPNNDPTVGRITPKQLPAKKKQLTRWILQEPEKQTPPEQKTGFFS